LNDKPMSTRAPSAFKQRDVTRAVKAVTAAGVGIARVEIDREGKITIIATSGHTEPEFEHGREPNEWDSV
jgi:hypothetical protein